MGTCHNFIEENPNKVIKSPIKKENYLNIFKKFSVKNQIINNIDIEKEFKSFIKNV